MTTPRLPVSYYSLGVAAASALAGGVQLVTRTAPNNIAATMHGADLLWSVLLLAGGATVIYGSRCKRLPLLTAMNVEMAGHVAVGTGWAVYSLAAVLWMNTPWWVSPAVWVGIGIAAAALGQIGQIRGVERRAKEAP